MTAWPWLGGTLPVLLVAGPLLVGPLGSDRAAGTPADVGLAGHSTAIAPADDVPDDDAGEEVHDLREVRTFPNLDVRGPGNAAAQTFSTADDELRRLGAWIVSESATGTLSASVRTDVTDPDTEITSGTVDLAALGGTGEGWLELDVTDVAVEPGAPYALVLQADGTDGAVTWWGERASDDGAPTWNYDLSYWGGWVQHGLPPAERFAGWNLAFYVNDALAPAGCAAHNECWRPLPVAAQAVQPAGLVGTPDGRAALSAFEVTGARYLEGSSVLQLSGERWLTVPEGAVAPLVVPAGDPATEAQVAESRAWLALGRVPGKTETHREMAERALLDLRLLLQDNGAVAAAWHGAWMYSWPRDSSFVVAAFTATGHLEEAYRILRFTAGTQRADGTWDARAMLDGSGPPDSRPWQLDANGWVLWATWQYLEAVAEPQRAAALDELYPMVRAAADYAAQSLDENGIPPARPDYWESGYPAPNLGTAAPLLAGLRAAAAIAELADESADAERWFGAASRLQRGIDLSFGTIGYQRTIVDGSGKDSAVTWLAPPFTPADDGVRAELDTTWDVLVQPTGGVQPGQAWRDDMTWTPETMFFALAWASDGQPARAEGLLDWLAGHRTAVGAFPEKVAPSGQPAAVATLGWTASLTLLTLAALEEPLPSPPVAPDAPLSASADPTTRAAVTLAAIALGALAVIVVAGRPHRSRPSPRQSAPR